MMKRQLLVAGTAFVVVIPFLLLLDRSPPAKILEGQIEPSTLKAGECGTIKWKVEMERNCPSTSDPRIYTSRGNVWPLKPFESNGPQEVKRGAVINFTYDVCIPWTMRSASASYHEKRYFKCFPFDDLWPIEIQMPPINFRVEDNPTVKELNPLNDHRQVN